MFSNVLFSTFAVALILNLVGAEPVDRRFDVGSAIDSATAAILSLVSVLTSDAASLYSEGTLEGVSWYTVGTSYAYVCVHQGVSEVSTFIQSNGGEIKSEAKSLVYSTVACGNGVDETIVASAGGATSTLVASSAGVATSIGGSEFTVIASPTSTPNGAESVQSFSLIFTPIAMTLVTVVGGTLLGAWITV